MTSKSVVSSSGGSKRSRSSSAPSEMVALAKAKAMAAKARMSFIEKEKELRKKLIDAETELQVLNEERTYEEARAEADAYETVSEWCASGSSSQQGKSESIMHVDRYSKQKNELKNM